MEFLLKFFYFKQTSLPVSLTNKNTSEGKSAKSDFPSVWRRVDIVKLYLYFLLIAKLMTGCFLRLHGKVGFTNCACCLRMIILLHLLNVSLNLFTYSVVVQVAWRSLSNKANNFTGITKTLSGTFDTDRYDCVGVLYLIAFLLSGKIVWRHATHSLCSLYLHFTVPKSLSDSKVVSRSQVSSSGLYVTATT